MGNDIADRAGPARARPSVSVLDASLHTEALTAATPLGEAARLELAAWTRWHAPAVMPAEVLSAVRGLALGGHLDDHRAASARRRLAESRVRLHEFAPYADRAWELRHNVSVYDAWYVAVAEALGVPLVTTDGRLAEASGLRCEVKLVTSS